MELLDLYEKAYVNAEERIDLFCLIDRLQLMLFTFKPEYWERDTQTLYDIKKALRMLDCHQQGYVDGLLLKTAPSRALHSFNIKCQHLFSQGASQQHTNKDFTEVKEHTPYVEN